MFEDFEMNYWAWWGIAAVLVILEFFAPGVIFLWLAIAAAIIGAILLIFPGMSLTLQIFLFVALGVATFMAARKYVTAAPIESSHPKLNQRSEQLVGRTYTVEKAIENGRGKIRVGDTLWAAHGPDAPEGTTVKVVSADGTVLNVEATD